MINPVTIYKRLLNQYSHKIHAMPILILMPHSSCNCRCIMCDIWKANNNKIEISESLLAEHVASFKELGVKWIVFSGGEALLNKNLWKLCDILAEIDVKISLLSTGLLLKRHAENIIKYCHEVIVSLDGSKDIHNSIRNIPKAYENLEEGVASLKSINKDFRVTARSVVQHENFRDIPNIIESAKSMMLDQVSFLAADVSSQAFNREEVWDSDKIIQVALSKDETFELESVLNNLYKTNKEDFDSKFIAESPEKLNRILQYYRAINKMEPYPSIRCNAPWISTVIESNGDVMPCYFHKPFGNINNESFNDIINSPKAISFRKNLDVNKDPICKKCVCTLKLGVTSLA